MIRQYSIPQLAGTAAGTATSSEPVSGFLVGVHISNNSAGTLIVQTQHSPQMTILTRGTAGTAWFYPQVTLCDAGGTALTNYGYPVINGYVQSVLNAAGTVSVTLLLER